MASGCTYEISREHMYMDMQQSESFCDYYTQITESKWGQEGYKVDRLPITAGTDMVSILVTSSCTSAELPRAMSRTTCRRYMHYSTFLTRRLETILVSIPVIPRLPRTLRAV